MKQKLLLKSLLLLFALIAGTSSVWAGSYSLTPNQASTGSDATAYITTLTEFEYGGISWKMNQWNPKSLQVKVNQSSASSEFRFYNTSAFPGRITSVVITFSAMTVTDATKFMFLGGSSEQNGTSGGTAGTWNANDKTLTWTPGNSDNFTYFAFYQNGKAASGTDNLATSNAIVVTFEGDDIQTCATPTFSPAEGTFSSAQSVTLSCSTDGATIRYTTDGTNPTKTSTAYSSAINVASTTTIKAKAFKSGMASSTISSATYNIVPPSANIAALTANTNTSAETKYVTLSNAVVTFVNGSYAYIQDASGAVLYYKSGHGLNAGDILNGTATVTYQLRNSNPQITALSGMTTTTGGDAPNPTSIAASAWNHTFSDVLSQYFQITGATITSSDSKYYISLGGENVQLYKVGTALSELNLTKKYTITGFPTLYNATKELYIFAAPAEEASADPIIVSTPTSLTGFTYLSGNGPSTAKSISVTGANLTQNISLTASTNYEISTTEGSGYASNLTLTQTAGTVAATDVYIRLKAGLASGDYDGTITLTSSGASDVVVNLSGSVAATATLPFSWTGTSTAGKVELDAVAGVDVNLANDYAASNAPYRLKYDAAGKYVIVYTNEKPEAVTFTAKIFAATTTETGTKIKVQGSADGISFTDVEEFTIKGASNATFEFTTSKAFTATQRAVKLILSNKDQGIGVGSISISSATAVPVTITDADYAAIVPKQKVDFSTTGVKAYTAKVNSSYVTLTEISKVPADKAVVVFKDVDATTTFAVPVTDAAADDVSENELLVSDGTVTTDNDFIIYALAKKESVTGFYRVKAGVKVPAGKAYLKVAVANPAPEFLGFGGEATGINEVSSSKIQVSGNEVYNLAGQRVAQPTKGLYIVNGKKVIVK